MAAVAALAAVLPFFFVVSAAVKDSALPYHYPPVWIPAHLYWGNFAYIIGDTNFLRWVFNTLLVAGAVTAIKVVIDSMAACAFARLHIPASSASCVLPDRLQRQLRDQDIGRLFKDEKDGSCHVVRRERLARIPYLHARIRHSDW